MRVSPPDKHRSIFLAMILTIQVYAIETTSLDSSYYKENINSLSSSEIYSIFNQDFWAFFSDSLRKYDTDLKKEVFKNSEEYKQRVLLLKNLVSEVKIFSFTKELDRDIELSDYDLEQGAFFLSWGLNMGRGTYRANCPKAIDNFYFGALPIQISRGSNLGTWLKIIETEQNYFFQNKLPLFVTKENAIKVEENKSIYKVILQFNVTGTTSEKYPYYNIADRSWYHVTSKVVLTDNVTIMLKNNKTGEIIYSKKYSLPKK